MLRNASVHLMFDVVMCYIFFCSCRFVLYVFDAEKCLFEMKLQSLILCVMAHFSEVLVLSFLCGIIYICLIDNSYYHQLDGDYMIKSLGLLFLTLSVCGGCVVGVMMRNNDITHDPWVTWRGTISWFILDFIESNGVYVVYVGTSFKIFKWCGTMYILDAVKSGQWNDYSPSQVKWRDPIPSTLCFPK